MHNLKLVILIVIIFIIAVLGIYYIYQSQVGKSEEELLPFPTPDISFEDIASPVPLDGEKDDRENHINKPESNCCN